MTITHRTELTPSEVPNLWKSYQTESRAFCGIKDFSVHIDDPHIRSVLEDALEISKKHVNRITEIMKTEIYPISAEFTEQEIDTKRKINFIYRLNKKKIQR
ncbi:DUF3231 family protein [Priestia megaterium]|uniref:DUF3231 family protein n=1 Tax=Priestia megaterium TaxID=1404 RepID=UPI001B3A4518|nr:DUF3231 family protein [Priestia megaterium]MBQ4870321.1 DUF3231 family protein [Priestia megaterium]